VVKCETIGSVVGYRMVPVALLLPVVALVVAQRFAIDERAFTIDIFACQIRTDFPTTSRGLLGPEDHQAGDRVERQAVIVLKTVSFVARVLRVIA
jgi:hypothetical protein